MKKLFLVALIFACISAKAQEDDGLISTPSSFFGPQKFTDYNLSDEARCQTQREIVSLPGALEILVNYTVFHPLCESAEVEILNQPYAKEFFSHYLHPLAPQTQLAILSRDDALDFFKECSGLYWNTLDQQAQIKLINRDDAQELLQCYLGCLSEETLAVMAELSNGKALLQTHKQLIYRYHVFRCPEWENL